MTVVYGLQPTTLSQHEGIDERHQILKQALKACAIARRIRRHFRASCKRNTTDKLQKTLLVCRPEFTDALYNLACAHVQLLFVDLIIDQTIQNDTLESPELGVRLGVAQQFMHGVQYLAKYKKYCKTITNKKFHTRLKFRNIQDDPARQEWSLGFYLSELERNAQTRAFACKTRGPYSTLADFYNKDECQVADAMLCYTWAVKSKPVPSEGVRRLTRFWTPEILDMIKIKQKMKELSVDNDEIYEEYIDPAHTLRLNDTPDVICSFIASESL